MTELGKIEKPEASQFKPKRKLFVVCLFYAWDGAPLEYSVKLDYYFQQVNEQITSLENKLGKVNHIYHESMTEAGADGLKALESSSGAYQIAKNRTDDGARLEALEDEELVLESIDWERHLVMGFVSRKVAQTVSNHFIEVSHKRYEHIARRIDETLKEGETGVLFIQEGHMVQFPPDIEVFSVAPPSLDELLRWLREHPPKREEVAPKKPDTPPSQ